MNNRVLCVGGPLAGERITETNLPERYCRRWLHSRDLFVHEDVGLEKDIIDRLEYGYEQHCKAVAERNKVDFVSQAEKWNTIMEFIETYDPKKKAELNKAENDLKAIQDHYTASFLRSCKTVIIPSPIGETQPLTLTYGKSYIGHLNDSMEFMMPLRVIEDESVEATSEKNLGRIGTPICIVP